MARSLTGHVDRRPDDREGRRPGPQPLPAAAGHCPAGFVGTRRHTGGMSEALDRFSPATRAWFAGAFEAATPAQRGAWDAIGRGEHTLVVAPTGSGKTLAAFLWSLDR